VKGMQYIYKYEPKTIDEFEIKSNLDFTNLLLIGGERTGKTTLVNILVRDVPSDKLLYINSLKEQGIQYYRNDVKFFCQTTTTNKVIVIDGLDELSEQSQQIFLNYIDKYTSISFIATCSTPQKIIESMYSRFMIMKLNPPSETFIRNLIHRVITQENISIEDDAITYLMSISNNSIRTILNYLEKYKIINIPITKTYIEQTTTDIHYQVFESYTSSIMKRDTPESVAIITQLYSDGYSIMDILDAYYEFIKKKELDPDFKYKLIKTICKYIIIFNNIHEHHIELLFFVEDCINISNEPHSSHM
jgi:replication-associated recombination protein RarA